MRGRPMDDPGSKEPKIGVETLYRAAVDLTWNGGGNEDYERGVVEVIAEATGIPVDETRSHIIDMQEMVEQEVADEIKAAKEALTRAEDRLSQAKQRERKESDA